jgi:hypothetical protein
LIAPHPTSAHRPQSRAVSRAPVLGNVPEVAPRAAGRVGARQSHHGASLISTGGHLRLEGSLRLAAPAEDAAASGGRRESA